MPTGYEVSAYRAIDLIAQESRAQTKALEAIAEAVGRIAPDPKATLTTLDLSLLTTALDAHAARIADLRDAASDEAFVSGYSERLEMLQVTADKLKALMAR